MLIDADFGEVEASLPSLLTYPPRPAANLTPSDRIGSCGQDCGRVDWSQGHRTLQLTIRRLATPFDATARAESFWRSFVGDCSPPELIARPAPVPSPTFGAHGCNPNFEAALTLTDGALYVNVTLTSQGAGDLDLGGTARQLEALANMQVRKLVAAGYVLPANTPTPTQSPTMPAREPQ